MLKKNDPAVSHTTAYRLNNLTIEVDLSEVGDVYEGVEGHFETQDNPETGARWVFKAHSLRQEVAGGGGPLSSPPPPS